MWFITGVGRGLGRAFAEAALEHGDEVAGTVRDGGTAPDGVRSWHLDVTDRAAVLDVVEDVVKAVGVPDVVVNNAGYGLVGAIEELSGPELEEQFAVNFFGAAAVTQAVLPHLRARGSGRIVQVSSVGAVGHLPLFGAYNATKWALEGMSAALADEVAPFGIKVHLLELGGFATDWAGSSMRFAQPLDAYAEVRSAMFGGTDDDAEAEEPPSVAAKALLDFLDEPDPPLRKVIGRGALDMVRMALEDRRDDYLRDPSFVWPPGR
ncbi:short-chain dehydrogenase/reductase [Winogradskya humida]|uniref:Short-chain dehydrogenase/reductase n=1 Tax=Winogradskya humida TaxID=113566 RepID=A0ABQ3ZTG9_9ACTN|nr:short-chain dehydrogenase/reductase [Actinoplanes humidus]